MSLKIAHYEFKSRLILGTGKYKSFEIMNKAIIASGTELVTVAIRRVDLSKKDEDAFINYIPQDVKILPNTAGCYTVDEAIRTAFLARELTGTKLIKLEVIADEKTLYPDPVGLVEATKILKKEGFIVLPYTNDDPVTAKKLLDAGADAIMPLLAPIGSGLGIQNKLNLMFIREVVPEDIPLIVDAGVGTPSDAVIAMELGADGVLMNTAVALAEDPVKMAEAMKLAVEAGYLGRIAGRMEPKKYASPSSPITGKIS